MSKPDVSLQDEPLPALARRRAGLRLSLGLRPRRIADGRSLRFNRGCRIVGIRRTLTTDCFVARRSLNVLDFVSHFNFTDRAASHLRYDVEQWPFLPLTQFC